MRTTCCLAQKLVISLLTNEVDWLMISKPVYVADWLALQQISELEFATADFPCYHEKLVFEDGMAFSIISR